MGRVSNARHGEKENEDGMTKRREQKRRERTDATSAKDRPAHRVRLPGFVTDEQVGLGDAIERMTSYVGFRPCGACKRRAAALNRWMVFTK
jgi:hypothetical protein